jgi:hypothetical protein
MDAHFNARRVKNNVYLPHVDRENFIYNPVYCCHPSVCMDLQSPLAIPAISPAHNLELVGKKHYITGTHSGQDPHSINYKICMFLPHEDNQGFTVKIIINEQLDNMQKLGLPTSSLGLENAQVTAVSARPVASEIDDSPITNNTAIVPTQLELANVPTQSHFPLSALHHTVFFSWLACIPNGPRPSLAIY